MSLLNPNSFLLRQGATAVIRETGLPVKESTLENLAASGKGPPYRIVNGRAVYTRADLEAWLTEQVRGASPSRNSSNATA